MKSKAPVKFLLVDDLEDNLLVLEALLRRQDLVLLKAHSGAEALELLLQHPDVALALLDVQMPGMDGFELAELMRGAERTKHVPIIFVTAGAHDSQRMFKGYESGAVDFLFKPVDPNILKSKAEVFFRLEQQRKQLSNALHLSEMFIGILGHDLRNPLNAMLTGTRLLEEPLSDEQRARALDRMRSAGLRMARMIEQLLDLTRARMACDDAFRTSVTPVDINQLLHSAVEELRVANPTREIHIDEAGRSVTQGDADRLLQVFSNIIANAITHGAPNTSVRVSVNGTAQEVAVHVHNRGAIPPATLNALFDPFRGQRSTNNTGLGLGLYIVQQITQAHGGNVDVQSSDEAGTTVTVRLPRLAT